MFTTFWIVTAVMFCGGVVALMISGLVLDWGKQVGGEWLKDKIQALYPQYRNHAKIRPLLDSAWQHAGCGNYPINHLGDIRLAEFVLQGYDEYRQALQLISEAKKHNA